MFVVADTSLINYLILIHQDNLLPLLDERVVIPSAVRDELQRSRTPTVMRVCMAHPPAWFAVRQPEQRLEAEQFPKLGGGEREAIVLAHELQASLLLMDGPDGREEAARRALRTTGTLGILEQAAMRELLDLPSVLTQLFTTTTFRGHFALIQAPLSRDAARKSKPSS
jgi:predicted nucleic acid-binding protein